MTDRPAQASAPTRWVEQDQFALEQSAVESPAWTDQVTDLIVDTVDKVRDRTTGNALKGARAAVFGTLIMIVAIPSMALMLIGLVRLLDWAIPEEVWVVYLGLGGIFSLLGALLWSRRGDGHLS